MYIIAYDFGTTGVKTCLYQLEEEIKQLANAYGGYGLYLIEGGGAEQDAEEWWGAMCATTKQLFQKTEIKPEEIAGISFCSQMQGLVLVDQKGKAIRRPMSYMDQRAKEEMKTGQEFGPQIANVNVTHLFNSLWRTHAASTSVKDPVWKYKWVEKHEPENFRKIYKWLDVKEYLIGRCTNRFVMTRDSAYATFLYDTREGDWSDSLCKMYGVRREHLPEIVESTDLVGGVTKQAAEELGLKEGTAVYGGAGDAAIIGVGAGCVNVGDTHIYSGTSGWVCTVTDKQVVDIQTMIAAIVGAQRDRYHYFAEMETAGKCFEWVKNHLALDEIGVYLDQKDVTQSLETVYTSLYDYLTDTVKKAPAGAGGVIFTPWLHGNRCPFEDPNATGMFFNIQLDTGKTELIRAVLEGICYHLRWMLECEEAKIQTSKVIRFVGGGALSDVTSQILADITHRTIETVKGAQDVGAAGAALLVGVGSGQLKSLSEVKEKIPVNKIFYPNEGNRIIYDRNYQVFQHLYRANKKNFQLLNQGR